MPNLEEIENLVIATVRNLSEDFVIPELNTPKPESSLYGNGGPLDSMALVNLIADIEEAIGEHYNIAITLADEKAISARNSPFATVRRLAEATAERIADAE
ncbi:MAG: hypothetical protein CNE95_05840 [Puniceicoccaceae bacterium MED-G30]|nr:MAG: hypothetical protein CNE95_05840 [Puniceicoccaceae bacterium MED-G30]|tara:strand:+ start:2493 stop:2795 length:303 start_codon:yes stop_codon:yes gene_type:complete